MRLTRFSASLSSLFWLCALLIGVLPLSAQSQDTPPPNANGAPAVSAVGARLQKDINALTALPSRVPGTPGNRAAAAYVQNRFSQIGLSQVRADDYFVTTPVTKSATVSIGGQELPVLPVYPNQVVASTTPVAGISGPLVYVGQGRVADFNGKKIEGSIAVLDFNSGMNWITAIDLGARAIIFLEPESSNRGEAERKFTFLPVEVPRFYAPAATAAALRAAEGQQANLRSLVVWEKMPTKNILGFLAGQKCAREKGQYFNRQRLLRFDVGCARLGARRRSGGQFGRVSRTGGATQSQSARL